MEEIASGLGLRFRCDPAVFPRLDGDPAPLALRCSPDRAARVQLSSEQRRHDWISQARRDSAPDDTAKLYLCGAGRMSFYVDAWGSLRPCMMVRRPAYDLTAGTFADGWENVIMDHVEKTCAPSYPCNECDVRALCDFCPGFFELENGTEQTPSDYLCALAHSRAEALKGQLTPEVKEAES
jgi:radical SAM protein with 4Fe4S-binding SPASM domain